MSETPGKLRLGALVALVVGSMIGGGIFSLPQNMAASADVGAVLIGWVITAIGMLTLAFVFQTLANRKPDLDGGVYAYAKAGCGEFLGFNSAWGYWISAWIGNVSYLVLLFSTLGYFFPIFGEGNTPAAVIGASVLLWAVHFLVLRGIKEAAFINLVTTVAKVVPLVLFVLIALFAFKLDIFTADIWGVKNPSLGSVMNQVRNMMLVTVWVFIGIEGASIYSARAEKRSDVGTRHLDRFSRCAGAVGAGECVVIGDHEPVAALATAKPLPGGRAGTYRRAVGGNGDQHRPGRVVARRIAVVGAAVCRNPLCHGP